MRDVLCRGWTDRQSNIRIVVERARLAREEVVRLIRPHTWDQLCSRLDLPLTYSFVPKEA